MQFATWEEDFKQFGERFEPYLAEFPTYGWHQRYLDIYRERFGIILNSRKMVPIDAPFQHFHAAVMILLDGRRSLSPAQRKMRKTLVTRWQRLHNAASARNKTGQSVDGGSYWGRA